MRTHTCTALDDVRKALGVNGLPEVEIAARAEAQGLLGMALAHTSHHWGAIAALSACIHLWSTLAPLPTHSDETDGPTAASTAPSHSSGPFTPHAAPSHRRAPTHLTANVPPNASHRAAPSLPARNTTRKPAATKGGGRGGGGGVGVGGVRKVAGKGGSGSSGSISSTMSSTISSTISSSKGRGKAEGGPTYPLMQRGLMLLLCDRPDAALQDLSAAIACEPSWARAHYLRCVRVRVGVRPVLTICGA